MKIEKKSSKKPRAVEKPAGLTEQQLGTPTGQWLLW
jgi:hypothetical protein